MSKKCRAGEMLVKGQCVKACIGDNGIVPCSPNQKTILYRGYTIAKLASGNYRVKKPSGSAWAEIASNVATARKWIDADIIERKNSPNPPTEAEVDRRMRAKGYVYKLTPKTLSIAPLYAKTISQVSAIMSDLYPNERFAVTNMTGNSEIFLAKSGTPKSFLYVTYYKLENGKWEIPRSITQGIPYKVFNTEEEARDFIQKTKYANLPHEEYNGPSEY